MRAPLNIVQRALGHASITTTSVYLAVTGDDVRRFYAGTIGRQMTNHQRIGAISNTHVGIDFEDAAVLSLAAAGIHVLPRFSVPLGVGQMKKGHRFDFGSEDPPVLVECKCHRWTTPGGNAPSAKLTVWNEAMYYFAIAPPGYRRILFVLRDYSSTRRQTLAEHYISRYRHLVPDGVEIWEFDEVEKSCRVL